MVPWVYILPHSIYHIYESIIPIYSFLIYFISKYQIPQGEFYEKIISVYIPYIFYLYTAFQYVKLIY
jgi:hypothetical protein